MVAEPDTAPREHLRWRPAPQLRGLVDAFHGYRYEVDTPGTHRGLPSSAMTVVISFDAPLDVGWLEEPGSRDTFWGVASGLHTHPAEIFTHGTQWGIQIGLTVAGVRSIFGMPMAALARELVAVGDLLPSAEGGWYDEIASGGSWRGRFEALEAVLLRLAAARGDAAVSRVRPELTWAWRRIDETGGRQSVGSLAKQLGWGRRHLHRQFFSEYGVSPKQATRIVRFQRSKTLFTEHHLALADVAVACGYADQAHLTREWRALTGYSPWQWRRAEFPFVQDRDLLDLGESAHD